MWKNAGPKSATQTLSHCAIGTHLDISQEPFYAEIGKKTTGAQKWDANFERACAAEMPVDIAQKLFYAAIYRTNDRAQTEL